MNKPDLPRCATCAHWDRKYAIEPAGHRLCLAKKLDSDDSDGARVVLVQPERYAVFLSTGPKFGCVNYEAQA